MRGSGALYGTSLGHATSIIPMGQPQPDMVYTHTMVSIDSGDRNRALYPGAGQYIFKLPNIFKNVVAIRLLGMEVPASFYAFTAAAGNTTLLVQDGSNPYVSAIIPDGNYTPVTLCSAVQVALENVTSNTSYTVTLNSNTFHATIANTSNNFIIDTTTQGLGYFLGFDNGVLSSTSNALTGTQLVNVKPYNYMVLDLGDLNMIQEGDKVKGYFAKVPLRVDNFEYNYLRPECCTYNVAKYDPPIGRLTALPILWRFHNGSKIDFNGYEHSFLLEIITGEGKLSHPQINRLTGAGSH